MSTSSLVTQLVTAYEINSLSVEDISSAYDMEEEAVKAILSANSIIFRKSLKQRPEQISEDEEDSIINALKDVALNESNNIGAKVKAGIFLVNESKGRNDVRNMNGLVFNIMAINERIKLAKAAKVRSIGETIDIEVESNNALSKTND